MLLDGSSYVRGSYVRLAVPGLAISGQGPQFVLMLLTGRIDSSGARSIRVHVQAQVLTRATSRLVSLFVSLRVARAKA